MKVIGLDIATVTGFSCLDGDKLIDYGLITIPKSVKAELQPRLFTFKREITALYSRLNPDLICFEAVYSGPNAKTTAFLNMLRGIAVGALPEGTETITVVASSARLSVVGKGNCGKDGVFNWATSRYKLTELKDNELNRNITDAILLATYGQLFTHLKECDKVK